MLTQKNIQGDSSEAFAAFCFACDGIEVARPISNALPYDLVAKIDGQWKTVQVKTVSRHSASRRPVASLSVGSSKKGTRRKYTQADFDVLVAVDPIGMSAWLVQEEDIEFGKSTMVMSDKFTWKHCPTLTHIAVEKHTTPRRAPLTEEQRERLRAAQDPRKSHHSPSIWRQRLVSLLSTGVKPSTQSGDTASMLNEYAEGYGLVSIARRRNLHPSSVKERISRAILSMEKQPSVPPCQLSLLA